jgi:cation:H+ antiporter
VDDPGAFRVIPYLALFLAGLLLLTGGGHALVTGASALAGRLGLSSLVIGLTVVAWGTSAPELAVSLRAALRGQGDMALGNVVGSNIINILGVLGVSALVTPLVVSRRLVWHDVPVLVGLSAAVWAFGASGRIDRWEGAVLFAVGALYTALTIRASRRERRGGAAAAPSSTVGAFRAVLLVAGGVVLLVLGAHWLVEAGTAFARALGVGELVVGLTVVAVGTSLPEAAASVVAAWRGERDMAVGNAVGSNIFNIVNVLGLTAFLSPGGVPVPEAARNFDVPVMIAVAAACLPIFFSGHRIARWEGGLFVAYYAAYVLFLVLQAEHHDALPAFSRVMLFFVIPPTVATLLVVVGREIRRPSGPW